MNQTTEWLPPFPYKRALGVALVAILVSGGAILRERFGIDYFPPFEDRGVIRNYPGIEFSWYGRCEERGQRRIRLLTLNPRTPEGNLIDYRETDLICGSPERI